MQALQTFIDDELSRIRKVRDELQYLEMLTTQISQSAGRAKLASGSDRPAAIDTLKSEISAILRDRVDGLTRLATATSALASAPTPQTMNLSRAGNSPAATSDALYQAGYEQGMAYVAEAARRRELLSLTSLGQSVLNSEQNK